MANIGETSTRKRKAYQQRERLLVQQFVFERYPHAIKFFNMRMGNLLPFFEGKVQSVENADMIKVWRKFADAVVVTENEIIVIEAKIVARVETIGQLEMYGKLVEETPELQRFLPKKVRLVLVAVVVDPYLVREAEAKGIEVVLYRPDWAVEYAEERLQGGIRR
jgi:hypothetical protein